MIAQKSLRLACLALLLCPLGACSKRKHDIEMAYTADSIGIGIINERVARLKATEGFDTGVNIIPFNNYADKILAQYAAGMAPDILWVEVGFYVTLQQAGALAPLDEMIARDHFDMDAFYPGVRARFSSKGHVWALPEDTAPIACLYYNKKLFREAGLAYPNDSWTWDDMLAAAKKLTKRDAQGRTSVWGYKDNYAVDWINMVYSNGGTLVDDWRNPTRSTVAEPAAVEAVKFLADLINVHKVMPSDADKPTQGGAGNDLFAAGQLAMLHTGYWISATLRLTKDLDWDIAPFPKGPRAKGHSWGTGGSGWAISANAKDKEKAWKAIKMLTSEETQRIYVKQGYAMPALKALANSEVFLGSTPPQNKKFLISAPDQAIYTPDHARFEEANKTVQPQVDLIMRGSLTPAEGMKAVDAIFNRILFNK
ncbi:MAG: sugar ABC transporter substrate-binding protein [candidate division FCPU426 bacterium]